MRISTLPNICIENMFQRFSGHFVKMAPFGTCTLSNGISCWFTECSPLAYYVVVHPNTGYNRCSLLRGSSPGTGCKPTYAVEPITE